MGGSAPSAPKTDYAKDITSFVKGLKKSMPDVLGMENRYRDNFTGLNLGDISNFLSGTNGQNGVVGMGGKYGKQAGKQINQLRKQELAQMTGQTGAVRGLLSSLSPESAQMVAYANQNAADAQRNAMGLTGQEARSAQQFAREAAGDRGRVMDNSAMAAEVLNRDSILGAKRQEAYGATQSAYNLSNSFYTAPGLQALSAMPNSYQAGQSYLGIGLNGIGSAKPQLVDIGAGLNLGAAGRQNQFAASSAAAQQQAQQQAAYMSGGASAGAAVGTAIFPGVGTAVGGLLGGAAGYYAGS